jgi:hypothetical protein
MGRNWGRNPLLENLRNCDIHSMKDAKCDEYQREAGKKDW